LPAAEEIAIVFQELFEAGASYVQELYLRFF
jgi:hypothetical protein